MSYSRFSCAAAKYISHEIKLSEDREEIIAYAIENVILTIAGVISVILVGALFGAALPAAIAALSGGLLRKLSGGAHASTPIRCLIFGSLVYGFIGIAAKYFSKFTYINEFYLIFVLLLSLMIIIFYAPVDCKAKRIVSIVLRKRLKVGSICFVLSMMVLVIMLDSALIQVSLVLGALYQSITLLPFFNHK